MDYFRGLAALRVKNVRLDCPSMLLVFSDRPDHRPDVAGTMCSFIHSQVLDQSEAFLDMNFYYDQVNVVAFPSNVQAFPLRPVYISKLISLDFVATVTIPANCHSSLRLTRISFLSRPLPSCVTTVVIYTWRSAATFFFACSAHVSARLMI